MQGAQLCQPVPGSRAMKAKLFTRLFLGTATGEERAKWGCFRSLAWKPQLRGEAWGGTQPDIHSSGATVPEETGVPEETDAGIGWSFGRNVKPGAGWAGRDFIGPSTCQDDGGRGRGECSGAPEANAGVWTPGRGSPGFSNESGKRQRSVHWGGLLTLQPCSVWASWGPTDRVRCWPGTRAPGESSQSWPVHEHCQEEPLKFLELTLPVCFAVKRVVEGVL